MIKWYKTNSILCVLFVIIVIISVGCDDMSTEDLSPQREWLFKSLVRNGRQARDEDPAGEEEEEDEGEDEMSEVDSDLANLPSRMDIIGSTTGIIVGGLIAAFALVFIAFMFVLTCKWKRKKSQRDKDIQATGKRTPEASYYVNFWSADSASPLSEPDEKPRYLPQPLVFDHPGKICKNAEKFIDRCMRNTVKRTYSEPTKEMINLKKWSSIKGAVAKKDETRDPSPKEEDSVDDLKHKIRNFLKDIKESIIKERENQKHRSVQKNLSSGAEPDRGFTEKILDSDATSIDCMQLEQYEQRPPTILTPDISEIWATMPMTTQTAADKKVSNMILPKPTSIEGQIEKIEALINMCVENLREPFMEKFPDRAPSFGKLMKGEEPEFITDPRPVPSDDIAKLREYTEIFKRVFSSQIKGQEGKCKHLEKPHRDYWKPKTDGKQEAVKKMTWLKKSIREICPNGNNPETNRVIVKDVVRTPVQKDKDWRLKMLCREMKITLSRWRETARRLGIEDEEVSSDRCEYCSTQAKKDKKKRRR